MFGSKKKKSEEPPSDASEAEPLLPKSHGSSSASSDAEEQPGVFATAINQLIETFPIYDAPDENYQCGMNPSPLRLMMMNLGFGFMEIMSVLGAYMFLNTHMKVMFPKCEDHPIIDRLLGTNIGHGVLCEICSIFLWTFPLMCCLLVPWFHYWEFTDSRLYYECLRQKIFLRFAPRDFFVSPLIGYLAVYLIMGISVLVFGAPSTYEEWKMKGIIVLSFMFPIASFLATVYMNWDIKYFLITLANFVDYNVPWARKFVSECYACTEEELTEIYYSIKEDVLDRLENPTSADVFGAIYEELRLRRTEKQELVRTGRTSHALMTPGDIEQMKQIMKDSHGRVFHLLLWKDGYWLMDLLWMPQDSRGREFRMYFRLFAVGVLILQLAIVYMLFSTVIMYLYQQGWIESTNVRPFLWLKDLVVSEMKKRMGKK